MTYNVKATNDEINTISEELDIKPSEVFSEGDVNFTFDDSDLDTINDFVEVCDDLEVVYELL